MATSKLVTLNNLKEFKDKFNDYIDEKTWTGTKAEWDALDKSTLEDGIQVNIKDDYNMGFSTIDEELSETSTNPVQNKVVTAAINNIEIKVDGTTIGKKEDGTLYIMLPLVDENTTF